MTMTKPRPAWNPWNPWQFSKGFHDRGGKIECCQGDGCCGTHGTRGTQENGCVPRFRLTGDHFWRYGADTISSHTGSSHTGTTAGHNAVCTGGSARRADRTIGPGRAETSLHARPGLTGSSLFAGSTGSVGSLQHKRLMIWAFRPSKLEPVRRSARVPRVPTPSKRTDFPRCALRSGTHRPSRAGSLAVFCATSAIISRRTP